MSLLESVLRMPSEVHPRRDAGLPQRVQRLWINCGVHQTFNLPGIAAISSGFRSAPNQARKQQESAANKSRKALKSKGL